MTKIDLNQSPYFDDYSEDKKFHKILFRPGRAVQARELNQIQSAIQKQIERLGRHIFDQGAQVLPGSKEGVKYNNTHGFIKVPALSTTNTSTDDELKNNWLNKIIVGWDGVKAEVIGYNLPDNNLETRLFLKYVNASYSGTKTEFSPGDRIEIESSPSLSCNIYSKQYSVGKISSVIVEEGVYFFNGNFILVDRQSIFISPEDPTDQSAWTNNPTALVGLRITESVVTYGDDPSLTDNALNTTNFSAPGADRLRISADLIQQSINSNDSTFIPLVKVVNGTVQARVVKTEYSVLEDTLARRTNDESGDYSVVPFQIQIKDFLRNDTNNGAHAEEEFQFLTRIDAANAARTVFGLTGDDTAITIAVGNFFYPGTSYNTPGDTTSFIELCKNKISIKIDPGKAYVKGYEIEKLGTTIVDIPRARTLKFRNNKTISTPLGTYIQVTNLHGVPSIYGLIELHSTIGVANNKIGTARVLRVEFFQGIPGDQSSVYKLYLFDIKIDSGKKLEQLKSIRNSSGETFTCNCVLNYFRLNGSVSVGTSVPSSGQGKILGTGTSWSNDELQRLSVGDYVSVGLGTAAKQFQILQVTNDNEILVSPDPTDVSNSWDGNRTIDYIYSLPETNSQNAGLVFSLPDQFVYTVRGGDQGDIDENQVDTTYTTEKIYSSQSPVANKIGLSTGHQGQEFEDFSYGNYIIINETTSDWLRTEEYDSQSPTSGTCKIKSLGNSLEIYFHEDDSGPFYIIAPIINEGGTWNNNGPGAPAKEKSKTLTTATIQTENPDISNISLGKADVLRITKVESLSSSPAIDVTHLYVLDNGQRDYYYDIASIALRNGSEKPKGPIRVTFDYFHHTGNGNYFSVDSYPFRGNNASINYEDIPDFVSSDGTKYDLASCIDFRSRINDSGTNIGTSFSYVELPKQNLRCDYHFFEGRIDKLYLDQSGQFLIKSGNPDEFPVSPQDPQTGMVTHELNLTPYTASSESIQIIPKDTRRYTMRDIGKLENRIKNLEYYTSLSMLESDTNNLKITDAQGNDSYKHGYLVDNFSTFNGDLGSGDYRAAIDILGKTARPIILEDNVSLFEKLILASQNDQDSLRGQNNYKKTGDLFTLPYDDVVMVEQKKASRLSNVNPYDVSAYVGYIDLNPWSDSWRETINKEPINVQDEGTYTAVRSSFGPTGTTIDYTSTTRTFTGVETSSPEATGREILNSAGHNIIDKLTGAAKRRAKQDGVVRVPEGYANAGQIVPVSKRSYVSKEYRTTTSLTGKDITTAFTSTFVDLGYSTPVNLGERLVDSSVAEFMRSREVQFTAKAFMPNAKLYAFFDGINVTEDCKPSGGNYGDDLMCDSRGRLTGTFLIPNKEGKKFKTGQRSFKLTTSPKNEKNIIPDSFGEVNYVAQGFIDTKQSTTYSTRMYRIDRGTQTLAEKPAALQISETLSAGDPCPRDPIAQSFYVYEKQGCFITGIDVYFYGKPEGTSQPPVTLQLRTLDDGGFPSNIILPFGEVVKESSEIITNKVDLERRELTVTGYTPNSDSLIGQGTQEITGPWLASSGREIVSGSPISLPGNDSAIVDMIPTRFTFPSPIYLAPRENFCFVLISDSKEYNVWVAQVGADTTAAEKQSIPTFRGANEPNTEIGTNTAIQDNPIKQGTFFKSQNGISWAIDPTIDITFTVYKASFQTAVNGEIEFVNEELPLKKLILDPVETKNNSGIIRITHHNHGMTSGSKVVFSPDFDIVVSDALTTESIESTTITATTVPANLIAGAMLEIPTTGERRRIVAINRLTTPNEIIINSKLSQKLDAVTNALATSYVVPHGVNFNGIDADIFYNSTGHTIQTPIELDSYLIDLTLAVLPDMTAKQKSDDILNSSRTGGIKIFATENKRFDELMLITTPLVLPSTQISWNIQTTSSAGVNDSVNLPYKILPRKNLLPNQKIYFDAPMHISSYINESGPPSQASGTGPGERKSLNIRAVLSSSDSDLSPVIDTSRMSAYLITNRLDDPRGILTDNVSAQQVINNIFDEYIVDSNVSNPSVDDPFDSKLSFNLISDKLVISTTDSNLAKHLSEISVGKYVSIKNNTQTALLLDKLVLSVNYNPYADVSANKIEIVLDTNIAISITGSGLKIIQKNRFVDEIAPQGGSCAAKYVSKKLSVPRPSNALKIMFDASRDESVSLDLYYKLEPINSKQTIDEINWTKADYNLLINGVLQNITPDSNAASNHFSSYECTLNALPSYVGCQTKIVMRGGNPARAPQIKNFRLIALDE